MFAKKSSSKRHPRVINTVMLEANQTPTGRGLVTMWNFEADREYVYVLSECCQYEIKAEDRVARCLNCDERLSGKFEYSSSFPIAAFEMKRNAGYWYPWGMTWFGWEQFDFEVTFDE